MTRQLILWWTLLGAIVFLLFRPKLGWCSLFWKKNKKTKLLVLRVLQSAGLYSMGPTEIARNIKASEAEVADALKALSEEGLAARGNDLGILFSWAPEQWATTLEGASAYRSLRRLRHFISKASS